MDLIISLLSCMGMTCLFCDLIEFFEVRKESAKEKVEQFNYSWTFETMPKSKIYKL